MPEEVAAIEMEGARAGALEGVRKLVTGLVLWIVAAPILGLVLLVVMIVLTAAGLELPVLLVASIPAGVGVVGLVRAVSGVADIVSDRRRLRELQRSAAGA